jgi:2'-5' RNA ligase
MSAKTFHTALVVIPPESLWEPIQQIRRRFDRHVTRWMPHVTLLYPFRPREAFEEAERRIREACAGIAPFETTLAEFRSFAHGPTSHTMWLHPDPPEPWLRLYGALQAAFPDCDDVAKYDGGFTPHFSVGQARLPADLQERLGLIRADWHPLAFEVRELSLLVRDGEEPFRVDRAIPLS